MLSNFKPLLCCSQAPYPPDPLPQSLQRKVKDLWAVVCSEGSVPEAIVGRRLTEVDHALLCPPSEKEEQKQMVMKAICVVLATLIVVIMTKLLYDWWEYRTRGKLPCIVYRMP